MRRLHEILKKLNALFAGKTIENYCSFSSISYRYRFRKKRLLYNDDTRRTWIVSKDPLKYVYADLLGDDQKTNEKP